MIRYRKIVAIILTLSFLFLPALPVSGASEIKGTCGKKCSYTLSDDGVLTISGTGEITKKFNKDEKINKKIKSIVIEEGIEKIGDECFRGMNYQKIDVLFPDTLTEIGDSAFDIFWSSDIQFPNGLKKIGAYAFSENYLQHVFLPDSLEYLGIYAFSGGDYIEEVRFPKKLKEIPAVCFSTCPKLKKIEWPLNVTQINERAFEACKFENFKIPDTVEVVKENAFEGCSQLDTLVIGKAAKKISPKIVSGCYKLRKITNHSKISIPLNTMSGKRNWYVGKKKVTKLAPGKTATARFQKYKIKYDLDGGKVIGKKPAAYQYHQKQKLPQKVKKKGYAFVGWYISAKNDWELFPDYVTEKLYGPLKASAIFKKYQVTSKKGRIYVTVKDAQYGKKGYSKETDAYYFRYSENKDMSDARIYRYAAPYGDGLSPKLKKGKTYYVEITRRVDPYMEDEEDYEEPFCGWHCKRKVTIR